MFIPIAHNICKIMYEGAEREWRMTNSKLATPPPLRPLDTNIKFIRGPPSHLMSSHGDRGQWDQASVPRAILGETILLTLSLVSQVV